MARRGDVLRLKNRLGFNPSKLGEAVVVVQADALNAALSTVLVVPLDVATSSAMRDPTAVAVPRKELGERVDHVALTTQLRPIAMEDLAPGVIGRLSPRTQAAVDRVLGLVLDL